MKKTATLLSPLAAAVLLAGPATPAHAGPYWNKTVKCSATDPDGRKIPTRLRNGDFGRNHIPGAHNIRKCALADIPLQGNVDTVDGADIQYCAGPPTARTAASNWSSKRATRARRPTSGTRQDPGT